MVPGQIIKIGQHILNVGKLGTKGIDNSHFNSKGFTLEQKFEHTSVEKGTIEIRRHEVQISKIRLHDALRSLGQSIKLDETVNYMKTIETQTTSTGGSTGDGIEMSTQSDLSSPPDEDITTSIANYKRKDGDRGAHKNEMEAARKIGRVTKRLEKKGTQAMELSGTIHLWVQVCRDKRKADQFADMLKQKHLSLPEYLLDFFVDRFGLLKIAHEQLARFYLGLQKHAASNAGARVAGRCIGWIGLDENTHYMFRFSEIALDTYQELIIHSQGNVKLLAGNEKGKKKMMMHIKKNFLRMVKKHAKVVMLKNHESLF